MMRLLMIPLVAVFVAAAPAGAAHLLLKAEDCAELVAHVPDDDVAYVPDADDGVLPADLNNAGRIDYNTDDLVITIGHPLIAIDGVVGDQNAFIAAGGEIKDYGADLEVGTVTLRDGEIYFNGQRLTDNEARIVTAACADRQ